MTEKRKRAREYRRVSADRRGTMESPEQQGRVNVEHAAREGWELGEPYAETEAVSASRYAAKSREEFGRLVDDIEHGRFGADVLMLWEASRGTRQMHEWVRLVDGCQAAGISIYVTTHGRLYDPANGRDRRSLMEDGTDSEYESWKTSVRIRRTVAARAADGRPHGRAPYGYRPVYDERTGELVTWEEEPAEAAVIRDLFARLRDGESFRSIAAAFRAAGILTRGSTRKGKPYPPRPFSEQHLRILAVNPAYAALRVHQAGSGRGPRDRNTLAGAVDAIWPALVGRETFYAVHARLTDPSRQSTGERGQPKHLLSMIARAQCGGPLTAQPRVTPEGRQRDYKCRKDGCVRISADDLDDYATEVMLAYLARPDNAAWRELDTGPELAGVRADLAAARAELADWQRRAARREVSAASFAAVEPALLADIERISARERELSAPSALAGLLGGDARERWKAARIPQRRQAAKLLCSPAYLGWLTVHRAPSLGAPATERVTWDRES